MADFLPKDHQKATLVGRAYLPGAKGPAVVTIADGRVIDITSSDAPTMRDVYERESRRPESARARASSTAQSVLSHKPFRRHRNTRPESSALTTLRFPPYAKYEEAVSQCS